MTCVWHGVAGASRPVLALTAMLILAIGIGATTSIFSIVDAVLLRPLPWKDPGRLVTLYVVRPEWRTNPVLVNSWNTGNISWTLLKDLQQRSTAFEAFGAWQSDRPTLNGNENGLVRILQVTSSVLPMLGVSPVRGRFFTPEEDDVSTTNVLVSHEAWQRRFGGRDDILGLAVSLNEKSFSIVGVLPPGFRFGITEPVEFVLPMGRVPERDRNENNGRSTRPGTARGAGRSGQSIESALVHFVFGRITFTSPLTCEARPPASSCNERNPLSIVDCNETRRSRPGRASCSRPSCSMA